jgi:excisionase family DNA binding protein
LLYRRPEAAELLSISISTLDIAIARGLIASRKIGKSRLIPRDALLAFSQKDLPLLWPEKVAGKTTRHAENKEAAPLRRSASR